MRTKTDNDALEHRRLQANFFRALRSQYRNVPDSIIRACCAELRSGSRLPLQVQSAVQELDRYAPASLPAKSPAPTDDDAVSPKGDPTEQTAAEIQRRAGYERYVRLIRMNVTGLNLRAAVRAQLAPEAIQDMQNFGLSTTYAIKCLSEGVTRDTIEATFRDANIPEGERRAYLKAYDAANLPVTPMAIVRSRVDSALATDEMGRLPLERLDAGKHNHVYKATYKLSGQNEVRIFKPLPRAGQPSIAEEAEQGLGIDPRNAQLAMRNLATREIAEALGFDVVVAVEMGLHQLYGAASTLGIVMEAAQGKAAYWISRAVWDDPRIKRQFMMLQLLDHITGEVDRHTGNLRVHVDEGESNIRAIKVTGFDGDLSFGSKIVHPDQAAAISGAAVRMPPVIDSEMAAAIENLKPEQIQSLLAGKLGLREIQATKMRLAALKAHIATLRDQKRIIAPDEWSEVDAEMTPENSYWERERSSARKT